jgi:hypothetical protein
VAYFYTGRNGRKIWNSLTNILFRITADVRLAYDSTDLYKYDFIKTLANMNGVK